MIGGREYMKDLSSTQFFQVEKRSTDSGKRYS